MELMLFLGVLLAIVVMYLPGYLMTRGLAFDRFGSIVLAPLFSLPLITVVGVVLHMIRDSISGGIYFGIIVVLSLIFWSIAKGTRVIFERRGKQESPTKPLLSFPLSAEIWQTALLYIVVAFIICAYVYISALPTPDAFSRNDDTTVHLSLVRGFLDSGTYSTLNTASFLDWGVSGSYYPSTWHCIVAIVASVLGNQVTIATDATIIAVAVVTIPLGVLFLLATLFPNQRTVIRSGALFSVAFSAFPWGFVIFGQLLPNLLSFSLVAPTLAALIWATNEKRSCCARLIVVVLAGIASLVLAQANGVFTWGILAALFLISRALYLPGKEHITWSWRRGLAAALILLGACALWTGLFFAPFLQSVVGYNGTSADLGIPEAILGGLSFMFMARGSVQPMLSIFVLLGVIWTCKHRRYLWLSIAFALGFILYVATISVDPVPWRQFLSGFWYGDYRRIGSMTAIYAAPLAACGFAWTVTGIKTFVKRHVAQEPSQKMYTAGLTGVLVALLTISQIVPFSVNIGHDRTASLGLAHTHEEIAGLHSWERIFTGEERAFLQKAQTLIPQHALVINLPHDGTAWAYGTDGINLLFRRPENNGANYLEPEQNALIRTKLADIATNDEVADLINEIDAHYVLLLDAGSEDEATKTPRRYKEEDWVGIESITEETPGFTLLLSEGDMRLYEITG